MSKPDLDVALSDRISSSAKQQRGRQGSGGGGGGGRRSGPTRRERSGRPTPYSRGSRGGAPHLIRSPSSGGGGPTTISISNLLPSVDEGDLKEIFGTMGTITRACVHYNRDGRSQGTAEVTFARAHEAEQAIAEYDAAEVDGRPMYLKLIVSRNALQRSEGSSSSSSSSSSDQRCFNCNRRGHIAADCSTGRANKSGGGGAGCYECGQTGHVARQCPRREAKSETKEGECFVCHKTGHWARECPESNSKPKTERGGRGKKDKEKDPTTEDLDADMDDYFKKKTAEDGQPTQAEASTSVATDAKTD